MVVLGVYKMLQKVHKNNWIGENFKYFAIFYLILPFFSPDHPSPPSGKPLISALLPSSLTLSWSGPSYDGGSAVLNYKVEVNPVGQDSWRLLTDTCVSTSYHVSSGLVSGEHYQFRVRACNAYGESEPGEESEVITMSSSASKWTNLSGCWKNSDQAQCDSNLVMYSHPCSL